MSDRKYARYIVTEDVRSELPPDTGFMKRMQAQRAAGDYADAFHLFRLDDKVAAGALYFDAVWINRLHGTRGWQVEIQHAHDFDEIICLFGSNRDNFRDLGGEVELWLEDEQYFLTQSCTVFVPAGMNHLPLYFRRIDGPILFMTMGNGKAYTRSSGNEV
ncbi:MAG TPA: hypothetical protein VLH15_00775 [Dehalococcoidales bacterium]|nr:hypothetical protein [Dehalococcoidales bacterium]